MFNVYGSTLTSWIFAVHKLLHLCVFATSNQWKDVSQKSHISISEQLRLPRKAHKMIGR